AAEDLVEERELQLAEPGAAEVLVEEQRPEALVLHLLLERVDERLQLGVTRPGGAREDEVERLDLVLAEVGHPVELLLELRIGGEVPCHASSLPSGPSPDRPCSSRCAPPERFVQVHHR